MRTVLIIEEPAKKYIDFLNLSRHPHEIWMEGKTTFLKTPAENRPVPKKEMIIGLSAWIEKEY